MPATPASDAPAKAKQAAGDARDSKTLDGAARLGLIAFGVVHLLVGWLALQLALGSSDGNADNQGALHQLAETPIGKPLLWFVAAGFVALVLWQLAEAALGRQDEEDGSKRNAKRALSAAKAVVFGVLAYSSARVASGSGSSGGGSTEETWTARLMEAPLGQGLVALVGVVIIGIGAVYVYRGWKEKFRKQLEAGAGGGQVGRAIITVGKVGHIAKGIAFAILGSLFVVAGIQHDAQESGGLDEALKKLLEQPYGNVLLAIVGIGIACFGLYCFGRARYLKQR